MASELRVDRIVPTGGVPAGGGGGIIQVVQTVKSDTESLTSTNTCLLYTSPSPRDVEESRMPSSA